MEAAGRKRIGFTLPPWLALGMGHVTEAWARLTNGTPMVPLEGVRMLLQEFRPSSARAERELGVTFRPIAQTIHDVVAWYGAHAEVMAPAGTRAAAA